MHEGPTQRPRRPRWTCGALGLATALLALCAGTQDVAAQLLPVHPARYVMVSELRGVESLWGNPAALAFETNTEVMGLLSFAPDAGESGAGLRQALAGGRAGMLAIGLRRDRFRPGPDEERLGGTGLTISVGLGTDRFGVGLANDQYRRGISSSRWELGGMWRATDWLTAGASWRNIGSPRVIAVTVPERFTAGVTARLPLEGSSVSLEAIRGSDEMVGYRGMVRLLAPGNLHLFASGRLDGEGDPARVDVGLSVRFGPGRGFGAAGRDLDADTNAYALGGGWRF